MFSPFNPIKWSCFFSRTFYFIALLLLLLIPISFFCSNDPHWLLTTLLIFVGLSLGVFLLWHGSKLGASRPAWISLICLLLFCFGMKLFWILYAQVEPMQDYATFVQYAQMLAEQKMIWGSRYIALFPHIFGYSFFLGIIGKIVGFSAFLAPFVNVLLSTISCGLLFFLGNRLFSRRAAMIACVLWTLLPSQTIYNMYVLSEPLYTTGILLFFTLVTCFFSCKMTQKSLPGRSIFFGLLCGLVLAVINMIRPVGAIFLIGLLIYSFFLYFCTLRSWESRWNLLLFLFVLLVTYFFAGRLGTSYIEYRIGEEPSSTPGYSILVGLNENSDGRWNWEDSNLLISYSQEEGTTAEQVQQNMLEHAKERVSSLQNVPNLLWNKFTIFLAHNHACVNYGKTVLRHVDFLSLACNSFYLFCCLLAIVGIIFMIKQADLSPLFLIMIYLPGLVFAQMLVEVAGRYHYSLLPIFILFGAQGVCSIGMFFVPYQGKRLQT